MGLVKKNSGPRPGTFDRKIQLQFSDLENGRIGLDYSKFPIKFYILGFCRKKGNHFICLEIFIYTYF